MLTSYKYLGHIPASSSATLTLLYLIQCCITGFASCVSQGNMLPARLSQLFMIIFNCSKIISKLSKVKFMHLLFLLTHLMTMTSVACPKCHLCVYASSQLTDTWHSPILTSNICVSNITKCHQKILENYKII